MREYKAGHGCGRKHIAHYKRDVGAGPNEGRGKVTAYGVDMDVEIVDVKVYPVEDKSLDKAKDGFAEKAMLL